MKEEYSIEIKVNKEIRRYKESIFFGLTFRQFLCSAVAVGAAVAVYFGFRETLGNEAVSWVCILAAVPVAAAGFFKYQGLPLEQFIKTWIESEFIRAGRRVYRATNYLYTMLRK
ncbi:PrgI family protein [Oscillospiraceae bacterium OttesenSCG-928-F05]|nr:PrgI family protein [Oscillospiraceae bacterium OttesenSCG-928-F05]